MDEEFEEIDREHIGDLKFLGDFLAFLRVTKNLSQRQVALYADISNTELHRLEKGERQKPSPKILKKLSEILDVQYEVLLQYAGYLDLQDDTTPQNINLNYSNLSLEEKDYILTYLCNKWNNEAPNKSKKYTKEEVESVLFDKKDIEQDTPEIRAIARDVAKLKPEKKELFKNLLKQMSDEADEASKR